MLSLLNQIQQRVTTILNSKPKVPRRPKMFFSSLSNPSEMCFFHHLVNQFLYAKYCYCQAQLQLQLQLSWELRLELLANIN